LTCLFKTDKSPTDPTLEDSLKNNERALAEYYNLNSFAAQLFGRNIISSSNFALWQLRTALEQDGEFNETSVEVAKEWIKHAGEVIWKECKSTADLDEYDQRVYAAGPGFKSEPGFSKER
jgi:hypothetical protein